MPKRTQKQGLQEPTGFDADAHRKYLHERGSTLGDREVFWRDKQPFLESHGYMLRPRYRVNWVPSWVKTNTDPEIAEDFCPLPQQTNIMDATRISDSKLVFIKRIQTQIQEGTIAQIFTQDSLKEDPRNHCVPVLDLFQDNEDGNISYMVMPFLRNIDDPPFETIDDIVEVGTQLLQGLVFMHAQGVAHRDCAYMNLRMDADVLYPQGFHPVITSFTPDMSGHAKFHPRYTTLEPVKYYFVDFGISSHFPPEQKERLVVGQAGLDQEVPELSPDIPYDPFKVDIFVLGNFFKHIIYQKFSNVEFLNPLIQRMTSQDPNARPDAQEAFESWTKIRSRVGMFQRGMPLELRANTASVSSISRYRTMLFRTPLILVRELCVTVRKLHVSKA